MGKVKPGNCIPTATLADLLFEGPRRSWEGTRLLWKPSEQGQMSGSAGYAWVTDRLQRWSLGPFLAFSLCPVCLSPEPR